MFLIFGAVFRHLNRQIWRLQNYNAYIFRLSSYYFSMNWKIQKEVSPDQPVSRILSSSGNRFTSRRTSSLVTAWVVIYLGRTSRHASCSLPRIGNGTSSSSSLLGLAPGGGYPAASITAAPVVSYTTISPLRLTQV
jgi:hypothetical protein